MLDENSKQNIRKHINTICVTAITVLETLGNDEDYDLVDRLTQTAEAIATHYEMEPELMEGYHALIKAARKKVELNNEGFRFADAEQAKEMIYALCDNLTNPKEIMNHVRTADEMIAVWEPERKAQT